MIRLLVVDDEPNVRFSLEQALASATIEVATVPTAREAIASVGRRGADVVILDVRLPDMTGLDAFDRIRQLDPRLPVIIITAFASTETAIEAMKRGAFEYLLKPLDLHELRAVVGRAIEQNRLTHAVAPLGDDDETDETDPDANADRIVGRSAPMQAVYKSIGRSAARDVTVLITGESGTGKELVARALYHHGRRSDGPFLAINCAAIPEALLESELFGHERGAFTGADRRRIGKFEQAQGGTIFLDEVGDMAPATQAKMLRLLQDGRFERVGGTETIRTDVRVLAATNRDLDALIEEGRFRADLLYRLKVVTIHLPALRDRLDDLPRLADHFVRRFGRELGKAVRSIPPEVLERLRAHDWPGNVRELQAAIKSALIQASGEVLTVDDLPESVRVDVSPSRTPARSSAESLDVGQFVLERLRAGEPDLYARVIEAVDRVVLEVVLQQSQGNQVRASELLGISRTTLRAKLRAAHLAVEKRIMPDSGPAVP